MALRLTVKLLNFCSYRAAPVLMEDDGQDLLALARAKMLQRLMVDFGQDEGAKEESETSGTGCRNGGVAEAVMNAAPTAPGDAADTDLKHRAIGVVVVLVVAVALSLALLAMLSVAFPKLLSPGQVRSPFSNSSSRLTFFPFKSEQQHLPPTSPS